MSNYRWFVPLLFNGTKGAVGILAPLLLPNADRNTEKSACNVRAAVRKFPSPSVKMGAPKRPILRILTANVGHFSLENGGRQLFETWES